MRALTHLERRLIHSARVVIPTKPLMDRAQIVVRVATRRPRIQCGLIRVGRLLPAAGLRLQQRPEQILRLVVVRPQRNRRAKRALRFGRRVRRGGR